MCYYVYYPKEKAVREGKDGAGRRFNLDVKDRLLMFLVYYSSVHTQFSCIITCKQLYDH